MFFFFIFLIAMLLSYECARYEEHQRFQEYLRTRYEVQPNPVYHRGFADRFAR